MQWSERYNNPDAQPTEAEISQYIDSPLWEELHAYLQGDAYKAKPKTSYSGCSMQPGWNVKYQKGGKSLCTLYPMEGFYNAMVVIGEKERHEFELLAPSFTPYIQALYQQADALMGARWLMIEVREEAVLQDVKKLIGLRRRPA